MSEGIAFESTKFANSFYIRVYTCVITFDVNRSDFIVVRSVPWVVLQRLQFRYRDTIKRRSTEKKNDSRMFVHQLTDSSVER